MKLLLAIAAMLLLAAPAVARNVLDAEPAVRIDSNEDATTRRVLPAVERAKNRVVIIKRGGKYLWASREGRELIHHTSGPFHYFVDPSGAGYVKVFDSYYLPAGNREKGPRYRLMEHVTAMMGSITYWGWTDTFDIGQGP